MVSVCRPASARSFSRAAISASHTLESPSRRFMRAIADAMSWRLLPVCSRDASGPDDGGQPRLVVEIVGGSGGRPPRSCAITGDAAGNARGDRTRHDAGLCQHDDGGLVEPVEELDGARAAAEDLVDVHGGVRCAHRSENNSINAKTAKSTSK